jgi:hypothetical protein
MWDNIFFQNKIELKFHQKSLIIIYSDSIQKIKLLKPAVIQRFLESKYELVNKFINIFF